MFSRTWLVVLAGSLALWAMNQLGGGSPLVEGIAGPGDPPGRPRQWTPESASALAELAACLDGAAAGAMAAVHADSGYPAGMPAVERWYRERCRVQVYGEFFDAFAVAYGERSRAAVAAILYREEGLAAGVADGAALDADVVWEAALSRAAADVLSFRDALLAWFERHAPSSELAGREPLPLPLSGEPSVAVGTSAASGRSL